MPTGLPDERPAREGSGRVVAAVLRVVDLTITVRGSFPIMNALVVVALRASSILQGGHERKGFCAVDGSRARWWGRAGEAA